MKTYWLEAKYECLKLLRMPGKIAPLILFPLAFYGFFGLGSRGTHDNVTMPIYLLGTYAVFGIMGTALMGIGAGLAVERGLGWLQVKRAAPMPAAANLIAKMAAAMLLGLITLVPLFAMGVFFGGVRISFVTAATFISVLVAGTIPFCALGVAIGYFAGAQSVHAVVNLFHLPMAFCSGLWIPLPFLPNLLKTIAPALPSYHLAQMMLSILNQPSVGAFGDHVAALAAFTMVFSGVAWIGYRLDDSRS